MGLPFASRAALLAAFVFFLMLGSGCQLSPTISKASLAHRKQVQDTTGLAEVETVAAVKARCAPPQKWEALSIKKMSMFTDMQWRSPTRLTGVGVVYVRLPLPFAARTLIWFAKMEYSKRADDGRVLNEWTDEIGRPWFEAENNKYHVRGYVVTKGFEAWIVYCGYRTAFPPQPSELATAQRSVETIMPTPLAPISSQTPTAAAD
jgi:hypothetical protein